MRAVLFQRVSNRTCNVKEGGERFRVVLIQRVDKRLKIAGLAVGMFESSVISESRQTIPQAACAPSCLRVVLFQRVDKMLILLSHRVKSLRVVLFQRVD